MERRTSTSGAFTLIELLIVVAIIAILAAIAVPNFLEAQVRSKVSRCRADMRSAAVGVEAYATDWNKYPLMRGEDTTWYRRDAGGSPGAADRNPQDLISPPGSPVRDYYTATMSLELTTPVSYLTATFKDPFKDSAALAKDIGGNPISSLAYPTDPSTKDYVYHNVFELYQTAKAGPGAPHGRGFDEKDLAEYGQWRLISVGPDKEFWGSPGRRVYDPTNGTVSKGDIIRTQNSAAGASNESTAGDN